jgi:hypothetical protein
MADPSLPACPSGLSPAVFYLLCALLAVATTVVLYGELSRKGGPGRLGDYERGEETI